MQQIPRKSLAPLAVLAVAVLISTATAEAKRSPGPVVLESPDESEASIRRGNQRISLRTGAPLALYRVGYRVAPGTPEGMARQYLRENAELLHLGSADLADLRHHATRQRIGGVTVRLRQHIGGIPVYKAEIVVSLNDDNEVTLVMSSYKPGVDLAETVPSLSAEQARRLAHEYLGVEGGLHFDRSDTIVYHGPQGSRLAYRVRVEPRIAPRGDWEVLVDAASGEIFKAADVALYIPVDGTGNVFDPDPLSTALATYGDPGFVDGNDADTPQLNAELINMVLRDIDLTGGIHTLVGPWAENVDWDAPFKGDFGQASSAFDFNRFDDAFEAANTYYQIDNYMRYMNVTLGIDVRPYQYPTGVRYDPSGFNGADNSSYSTGSGRLRFGEGGVDDAEDADVIIHELGHGIHDWVTGPAGLSQVDGPERRDRRLLRPVLQPQPSASGAPSRRRPTIGSSTGTATTPSGTGRITNYGATYPGGLVGQIHTDGQIWSTCNMLVWDAIGREQTDKAMLEGLAMTGSGTNQEGAAQALLQAAVDMDYSASELTSMAQIYQGCGYQVETPGSIFADGFESGDTSMWSSSVP